jgi:hypothetical protein
VTDGIRNRDEKNFMENFAGLILPLSLPSEKREFSSVGLEHLPYKQRVGGSTPSTPTKQERLQAIGAFFIPRY